VENFRNYTQWLNQHKLSKFVAKYVRFDASVIWITVGVPSLGQNRDKGTGEEDDQSIANESYTWKCWNSVIYT
jgi:hypothetical protein